MKPIFYVPETDISDDHPGYIYIYKKIIVHNIMSSNINQ